MKTFLCYMLAAVAICFFLVGSGIAQDQTTSGITAGMMYSQAGDPAALTGFGTFDKQLKGPIFSYNGVQIIPTFNEGNKIPQLEFRAFSGFAVKAFSTGKLGFFTQGAGGIATNGDKAEFTGNVGGFAHIAFSENLGAIAGAQGAFSKLGGKDALIYLGVRYRVK